VGGSLPVAYAYYSEFLPRSERGRYLGGLVMMWALGGVYVAVLAWLILPRTGKYLCETQKVVKIEIQSNFFIYFF
jgi:MFS family permease